MGTEVGVGYTPGLAQGANSTLILAHCLASAEMRGNLREASREAGWRLNDAAAGCPREEGAQGSLPRGPICCWEGVTQSRPPLGTH